MADDERYLDVAGLAVPLAGLLRGTGGSGGAVPPVYVGGGGVGPPAAPLPGPVRGWFPPGPGGEGLSPAGDRPPGEADGGSECLAGGSGPLRRRADGRDTREFRAGAACFRGPGAGLCPGGGPAAGVSARRGRRACPAGAGSPDGGGGAAGGVRRLPGARAAAVAGVGGDLPASRAAVPRLAGSPA